MQYRSGMQSGCRKNSDSVTFFLPGEIIDISTMTLPGALPRPLWHPPYTIMPYYLYTIAEKFRTDISGASHAPPPPTGAGLAQGGR
jgi:hypothetical protein